MILLLVIAILDDGSKLLRMEWDSAYIYWESKALPNTNKDGHYLVEAVELVDNNGDGKANHRYEEAAIENVHAVNQAASHVCEEIK